MARNLVEEQLSYFVDRDQEVKDFCAMLAAGSKRVLTVCGDEGFGKTLLMERLISECAAKNWQLVKVICRDTRNDALFIMRSLSRELELDLEPAEDALAVPSAPRVDVHWHGSVASNLRVEQGGRVGDITGAKVTLTADLMERWEQESARIQRQRLGQLTEEFVRKLAEVLSDKPIVVFIDDCHILTVETEKWLREELLFAVEQGPLSNVYFVLFSQRETVFENWDFLVQGVRLKPFARDDIAAYLRRRGLDAVADVTSLLLHISEGRVSTVASYVERLLDDRRRSAG
jgi:type II secretory pathway predicted ATPase ExeA